MNCAWVINGWRLQERSASAVTKALETARERGMRSYNISRIGRHYWLVCSRDAVQAYDLASTVRRSYPKVQQGIYLAYWREQVVVIVWRNDVLQHCLACETDADGFAHLKLLLGRLTRKSRRHSALLIAGSVPAEMRNYCDEHLAQWQQRTTAVEIAELTVDKRAKLRDMALPTPWQQRQRLFALVFSVLLVMALAGWYWWPQSEQAEQVTAQVQQALPDPRGVAPQVLQQLPKLFAGMQHLAGWEWRSASLQGQQLEVVLKATYGRPEELALQLDPAWQLLPQRQQAAARYKWPTEPYARQQGGFTINALEVGSWQRQLERLFPNLTVRQERSRESTFYQQQVFTLNLLDTKFTELARLTHLLSHPHLRIVKMNLQAGRSLRSELEVHLYEPRPISTEGAS